MKVTIAYCVSILALLLIFTAVRLSNVFLAGAGYVLASIAAEYIGRNTEL